MSEEAIPEPERPPIPTWLKWVVAVLIFAIVFLIQDCSGRYRTRAAEEEALARGVEAIAASLVPTLLQDREELVQDVAVEIAEAGDFNLVVIADRSGEVVGTTNVRLDRRPFKGFDSAGEEAIVTRLEDGSVQVTAGIHLAPGNRFGAIRVVAGDREEE